MKWLVVVFACFLASPVERVFGILLGAPASPGEFPYVVGIGRFSDTGYPYICTGGIIDEKFVITAAHCVTDMGEHSADKMTFMSTLADIWVFVYANTTNFQDDLRKNMAESRSGLRSGFNRATTSTTARKVVKGYVLSEYLADGHADIAILELESPLNLNDGYHQKLKLPSGRDSSYEGVLAVFAGYGTDEAEYWDKYVHVNDGSLKKAHFRIVPGSTCFEGEIPRKPREDNLCTIAVTEDNKRPNHPLGACRSDSGGPVVHGNTVIGIMIAVSPYTCDSREESVHGLTFGQTALKVRYYKDFINKVISNRTWRLGNNKTITAFKFRD